jgi:hypothetical protein
MYMTEECQKKKLPGGESNPALARSVGVTGACTNPIYYQGLDYVARLGLKIDEVPTNKEYSKFFYSL